jgi:multiple sugar transport system substrate-binding protein
MRTLWTRSLASGAAALLSASALVGGGIVQPAEASTTPVTLEFLTGYSTSNPQGQAQMLNQFIKEFERQNPGVKVTYETYDSASQELTDIETSVASHQGPTVMDLGFLVTAYATGQFYEFGPQQWKMLGGKQQFFQKQFGEAGPNPNAIYGVPWEINPFALVYNKAMFAKAGIKAPPTTWTQFVADAKKLTDPAKDQWGTGIDPADPLDPWHITWVMARQLGGNFVNANYTKATMATPPVVKALTFWFDWVTKYHIASPQDLAWKNADLLTAFEDGHIAMLPMQSYALVPALEQSSVKNDFAFAPMPTVPYGYKALPRGGVPVGTFISGDFLAVPKYVTGAQYTAAMKWIKFFTSVPQQREIFKVYGLLPVNVNAYKNYPPLETPVVKSLIQAEQHAYPYPFTGAWGNIEVAYGAVANKIADELATHTFKPGDIQALLQAADQQVQQYLK